MRAMINFVKFKYIKIGLNCNIPLGAFQNNHNINHLWDQKKKYRC